MKVRWDREKDQFFVKEKIDNQTFYMGFELYDETLDTYYFNIFLAVYNKRKHMDKNEHELLSTGKSPMKTIAYAIKAFELLEKRMLFEFGDKKIHISCHGLDNRRNKVYYKYLSKKGYVYGNLDGRSIIYKTYKMQM